MVLDLLTLMKGMVTEIKGDINIFYLDTEKHYGFRDCIFFCCLKSFSY
jgi:hypothetical protein